MRSQFDTSVNFLAKLSFLSAIVIVNYQVIKIFWTLISDLPFNLTMRLHGSRESSFQGERFLSSRSPSRKEAPKDESNSSNSRQDNIYFNNHREVYSIIDISIKA